MAPHSSAATATSAEPLTGGSPSTLPVVQITVAGSPYPCTGTLLSPSWVLTSGGCDASGAGAANVCLTPQGPCATGAPAVSTGGYYGTLVHLSAPLAVPSYAKLSTTALGVSSTLTCASQSPAGPVQGSFTVTSVVNAGVGLMQVTPGTATFDDMGDGCFEGGALAALQGKLDYVEDLSLTSAAITKTMCGGDVRHGPGQRLLDRLRHLRPVRELRGRDVQLPLGRVGLPGDRHVHDATRLLEGERRWRRQQRGRLQRHDLHVSDGMRDTMVSALDETETDHRARLPSRLVRHGRRRGDRVRPARQRHPVRRR